MDIIRVLIVDDEPAIRKGIRLYIEGEQDIDIVGECADGRSAAAAIQEHRPEVVFLDVQMPEMDGFEVLKSLNLKVMPVVIFVTAYDEYAVRAFEACALDYVLKPFDRSRLLEVLKRAKTHIRLNRSGQLANRLETLLQKFGTDQKYLRRVAIKEADRILFVDVGEIDWVQAADNYLRLHTAHKSFLLHGTISSLETKLDQDTFMRVHRSSIVNVTRIKEVHPLFHGEYLLTLRDGTKIRTSRGYRAKLQEFFANDV